MTVDRAAWLALARQVLAQDHPDHAGGITVLLRSDSGHRTTLYVPASGDTKDASLSPRPATPTGRFSELESAIVEVLTNHDVLTGPQIATLAGYPYESTLRIALASLRRQGVLVNKAPGYALAVRP